MTWNLSEIRKDFPILSTRIEGEPLVYLDSAATSQKPLSVIQAVEQYYKTMNANVHRGAHRLGDIATSSYEGVREKVAKFLGGVETREVLFTKGTTEACNLVASSWGLENLKVGDEVWVLRSEHHANFVPWQQVAAKTGAKFHILELGEDFRLELKEVEKVMSRRPKLFAMALMSNVLGTEFPVQEVCKMARAAGTVVFVDAAQAAAHKPLSISELGCDFLAFSAHKMCGPTGVGVLWGRKELLEEMKPYQMGGDMIQEVFDDRTTWNQLPWKFEAGTPNIAGVVGLGAAIDYFAALKIENISRYESELTKRVLERLSDVDSLEFFGPKSSEKRGPVFSFSVKGVHPHDLSSYLDTKGIAIRTGHHCAQPLLRKFEKTSLCRASFFFYNTEGEVNLLGDAIEEARRVFV